MTYLEFVLVVIEVAIDDESRQLLGDSIFGVLAPKSGVLLAVQFLLVVAELLEEGQVRSHDGSDRLGVRKSQLQSAHVVVVSHQVGDDD